MNVSERRQLANLKERLQRNDCAGALRILQSLSTRKASPKAKATRARQRADGERKRQLRAKKSTELHRAVMARGGWPCELGAHAPLLRVQMHHLKGGSAKRFYESVENCIRACQTCHGAWDNDGREQFRFNVAAWCEFNSYPLPPCFLREPRAPLRAPKPNPGQTHYQRDSCPGGHLVEVDPPAPQAPESLPERIAK